MSKRVQEIRQFINDNYTSIKEIVLFGVSYKSNKIIVEVGFLNQSDLDKGIILTMKLLSRYINEITIIPCIAHINSQ